MLRTEVIAALSAHYSAKFGGKVWAGYESPHKGYYIRGDKLPAHADMKHLYPNGWSLLDFVPAAKAQAIAKESAMTAKAQAVANANAPYAIIDTLPAFELVRSGADKLPMAPLDPANQLWAPPYGVPAVGAPVEVTYNGLGRGIVSGYFTEGGYLGLRVTLDKPSQFSRSRDAHAFGTEFAPIYTDSELFNCCTGGISPDFSRFDAIELCGCIDLNRGNEDAEQGTHFAGGATRAEAHIFTLYGHVTGEGVEAITDCATYAEAERIGRYFAAICSLPLNIEC